ncbi:CPBP family intramembrane metalloprotease [Candidatus Micrarchaeota archaeon]|nr:CPBP family intramembrane metalloprotease [Candidatus Micrarchaeota archaeon]
MPLSVFAFYAFLLLLPLAWLQFEKRRPWPILFKRLGLQSKPIPQTLALGALIFFALMAGVLLLSLALGAWGWLDFSPVEKLVAALTFWDVLLVVTLAPVAEELFFRGFLLPRFGLPLSSIAFALGHAGFASVAVVASAFLGALVLGYAYQKTGNLYACMLGHALFNVANVYFVSSI